MLVVDRLSRPGLGPVALSVDAGECVIVSGPSGAGKTLLLRAIADLDPNEGRVLLGEISRHSIPAPAWRRRVRYVATESAWWADRVADHFRDRAASAAVLEALGLPAEAFDWPVVRLSTGERQRLSLARALEDGPNVLLLDEPTSALDAAATARAEAVLRDCLERGTAILLVTHDESQAARLGHRQMTMAGGRLRADGGPRGTSGGRP